MMNKIFTPRFIVLASLIVAAAFARLIPHWPNFTPVAALALFGGTYINRKHLAILVPLIAMILSDIVLGFHNYMFAVYASLLVTVGIGFIVRRKPGILSVAAGSLVSSVVFFLITNFAVWMMTPAYSSSFSGLLTCYVAGIPFFNNGIMGDLFFNTILFGSFYAVTSRFPALQQVKN
jgi:hypothetical protein